MPGPGPAEAVGSAEEEEGASAVVEEADSAVVGVTVEVAEEANPTFGVFFSCLDSTRPFGSSVHTTSPNRNPNHRLGSVPKSAEMIIGRTSPG